MWKKKFVRCGFADERMPPGSVSGPESLRTELQVTAMKKSVRAGLNDCREINVEMDDEYMHKEENNKKAAFRIRSSRFRK